MTFSAEQLDAVIKAYDIRGLVGEDFDADLARAVGAAAVEVLSVRADAGGPGSMVIGYDMRDSSPAIAQAIADGVTAQGANAKIIGLASTDQLYFASGALELPGAMVTASHNPAQYNGIKLCRAKAAPVGQDTGLAAIRQLVEFGAAEFTGPSGTVTHQDLLADYAQHLRSLVPLDDIRRLRIVIDAGNGMAGHTAPAVLGDAAGLAPLPLDVVPMYFELDGTFPNHEANPIDPATLVALQRKVREEGADLGLAFDGDADRCFVVDEKGNLVSPSVITALIAQRELQRVPGAAVIHNLITSRIVAETIIAHGGRPIRTRVGHSFIKARMAETDAVFGGEHSGHFYFADFWRADSGMLAALHVLAALGQDPAGQSLSELLAPYNAYVSSGEVNSTVFDTAAATEAVRAHYALQPGITMDDLDGLTVASPDWWFNLRPSNTEPLLRLNVEAGSAEQMQSVRDNVLTMIRS